MECFSGSPYLCGSPWLGYMYLVVVSNVYKSALVFGICDICLHLSASSHRAILLIYLVLHCSRIAKDVALNPTRVIGLWFFSQNSGKRRVCSANTHLCIWVKTQINIFVILLNIYIVTDSGQSRWVDWAHQFLGEKILLQLQDGGFTVGENQRVAWKVRLRHRLHKF